MGIDIEPIGYVRAPRPHAEDDFWGGEQARIELVPQSAPDALAGLGEFSHIEVLFYFHQVDPAKIVAGARHPRNNKEWPAVGIFAQQARDGRIPAAHRRPATGVVARADARVLAEEVAGKSHAF